MQKKAIWGLNYNAGVATVDQNTTASMTNGLATKNLWDLIFTSSEGVDFFYNEGVERYDYLSQNIRIDDSKIEIVKDSGFTSGDSMLFLLNVTKLDNTAYTAPTKLNGNVLIPPASQIFEIPQPTAESIAQLALDEVPVAVREEITGQITAINGDTIHNALDSYSNKDSFKGIGGELVKVDKQDVRDAMLLSPTSSLYVPYDSIEKKIERADDSDLVGSIWNYHTRKLTGSLTVDVSNDSVAKISEEVEKSLLNESDGRKLINAIVGAIDNQNVDEVALVALIRNELERTNGVLRAIEADTNELQQNQNDWRTGTTPPTAEDTATAVREELKTELNRIDDNISGTKGVDLVSVKGSAVAGIEDLQKTTNIVDNEIEKIVERVKSELERKAGILHQANSNAKAANIQTQPSL